MIYKEGDDIMPTSTAQIRATNKWNKANYETILLRMDKGIKYQIQKHAENTDESVNSFINRAIIEAMERDKVKK